MRRNDRAYVNIVLGLWLFASAFLWRHGSANFANALVVGAVVAASAAVATRIAAARHVETAAGVWLIASLFAWPTDAPATTWNNFFVGLAIALVSLVGPEDAEITSGTHGIESTG